MIMPFNHYLKNNLVKKASPDLGEAEALMKKAGGRLNFSIKTRDINKDSAAYIFEDIYECLREAAQSIMALEGYKPYSHEALIAFLKEIAHFREADISSLDRYRILRNKTIYKGEYISPETCEESLKFLLNFLPKLKIKFEELKK